MALKRETHEKLQRVSTPTLATALYKRGLRQQFIQEVRPLSPLGQSMVGEAYTLRYMPAREDLNPITVFRTVAICSAKPSRNARRARC